MSLKYLAYPDYICNMYKELLLVGIGGGAGSILRYLFGMYIINSSRSFPYATFTVNVIGALLIGILMGYLQKPNSLQVLSPILVVGFCGGFTTFSTFSKETVLLFQQQQWILGFTYVILSLVCCLAATILGFFLAK